MSNRATEIQNAEQNLTNATEAYNAYVELLRETRHNEFVAQGGCNTCGGHGCVLGWWTLDGSGFDEIKPCDNPNCTAQTVGRDPTRSYPSSKPYPISPLSLPKSDAEIAHLRNLSQDIENAQGSLENVRAKWTPSNGKTIRVTRGSKGSDKGDEGVVFWTKEVGYQRFHYQSTTWTLKVGYKMADGTVGWTSSKCCEVINPQVPEIPKSTIEAKIKRESSKAYLMVINGKELWVPRSVVSKVEGHTYNIAQWFKDKNGL